MAAVEPSLQIAMAQWLSTEDVFVHKNDVRLRSAAWVFHRRLEAMAAQSTADVMISLAIVVPNEAPHSIAQVERRFNAVRQDFAQLRILQYMLRKELQQRCPDCAAPTEIGVSLPIRVVLVTQDPETSGLTRGGSTVEETESLPPWWRYVLACALIVLVCFWPIYRHGRTLAAAASKSLNRRPVEIEAERRKAEAYSRGLEEKSVEQMRIAQETLARIDSLL